MSSSGTRRGWYHGWNIVAVCVLSQVAFSGIAVNTFSLFLHSWARDLHAQISTLQLGFSAYGLISACLAPIGGLLADKYPSRLLFGTGLLITSCMCIAMSLATSVWQFLALYAFPVAVAANTAGLLNANAVVSRWFVRRLGLALALTALGLSLPGIVLPPLVAAFLPSLGWRMVWRICGIATALIVLPVVVGVLRDRPTVADGLDYLAGGEARGPHERQSGDRISIREIFARRTFWLLVALLLAMLGGYLGTVSNLAPLAISRGLTPETAGVLLSMFNLFQFVSTVLSGLVSDRIGNRLPLAGLAFASCAGTLLVAFGGSVAPISLGVALVGFGMGFWPVLAAACAVEFGAEGAGRAFGLVTAFLPAVVLTPFAVAKTQEITGSYIPALCVIAVLCLLAGAACLLFMKERRAETAGTTQHDLGKNLAEPSP